MEYSQLDCRNIPLLQRPQGKIRVVLDSDAFNEIDDQYALSYALSIPDRLEVEAIYAAPFFNRFSTSPADGMEKSYQEILRLLPLLHREDLADRTYRGSTDYLKDEKTPQYSPAARDLVRRAMEVPEGERLYVVAIGAITNVASALIMEPAIRDKIILVWLGGHGYQWPDTLEFNLKQDIAAARVVFGCGAPMVQLPCKGVVSHLHTTEPELREHMLGKSEVGSYLYRITCDIVKKYAVKCWSRVIWDLAAMMWVAGPEDCFIEHLDHSPVVSYDGIYSVDKKRHLIKIIDYVERDLVFAEFFSVLAAKGKE